MRCCLSTRTEFKLVNDPAATRPAAAGLLQSGRRWRPACAGDTWPVWAATSSACILESCCIDEAQHMAQKLCDTMDQYRYVHGEQRFRIGTSIGVAPLDARWPEAEAVMRRPILLHVGQGAGRNRVHLGSMPTRRCATPGPDALGHAAQQALDEDRFELHRSACCRSVQDDGLRGEVLLRLREARRRARCCPAISCRRRSASSWPPASTAGWCDRSLRSWTGRPSPGCAPSASRSTCRASRSATGAFHDYVTDLVQEAAL